MAAIRLWREVVSGDQLPFVCMRCGDPAVERKEAVFLWTPPGLNILAFVGLFTPAGPLVVIGYPILWLLTRKRMRVQVPLCRRHRRHWGGRVVAMLATFVAAAVLVFLLEVWLSSGRHQMGSYEALFWMFGIPVVAFLAWVILVVVLARTAMGALEMTNDYVTIGGVSSKFVDAVSDLKDEIRRARLRMIDEAEAGRPHQSDLPEPPSDAYWEGKDNG